MPDSSNLNAIGTKRKRRPTSTSRPDKGRSHQRSEAPRSDKGESHQRPAAPRSDKGLSHQTSLHPRSEWPDLPLPVGDSEIRLGASGCQSSLADSLVTRSVRSDKGGSHQAPETRAERPDKVGTHDKSSPSPSKDTWTAAQIYGEKYQSELRFLTCACCAFEGHRSGYRLLSDLKARGCLSWPRHTKRMIVEGLASSDSKYDRKYATILRDGLDEFRNDSKMQGN